MGSVMGEIECPQCGGIMLTDYYYMTDEEYMFCMCCGKSESWTVVCNEQGKAVIKKNGKAKYKHKRRKVYGCIEVVSKKGGASYYPAKNRCRKKDIIEFNKFLESDEVDTEKSYFTIWNEEKKKLVPIYGKVPDWNTYIQEV